MHKHYPNTVTSTVTFTNTITAWQGQEQRQAWALYPTQLLSPVVLRADTPCTTPAGRGAIPAPHGIITSNAGSGGPPMIEPTCINLEERFGRWYRVGWEADGATRHQWPEADRPWLMELRCRHGLIYPKGGDILQAYTTRRLIGAKLRRLPCSRKARGDVEVVVEFHVADIAQVFAILKPYRRRHLSEAQRQRLRSQGFKRKGAEAHTESDLADLESTNAVEHRGAPASTTASVS